MELNKRALIAGLLRPYGYRISRGIGFFFFFCAFSFDSATVPSFSRIFSPLSRFFFSFFYFQKDIQRDTYAHAPCKSCALALKTSHRVFRTRTLHYTIDFDHANSYRDKSWTKVWHRRSIRNLYSTVFESTRRETIYLFIFLFIYFYFLFFFFSGNFYTLYSKSVIEFTNRETCFVITCLSLLYRQRRVTNQRKKKKGIWIKKATGRENLVHDRARIFVHAI